ncbi:MAG: SNF2-related protein [Capsulimonadaceae bacterium]|nr:SNF2-related protein [Capsulimonadaceae bacterium]
MTEIPKSQLDERYRYIERLDSGQSVAQVWRALDLHLDSEVIIKKFGLNVPGRGAKQHFDAEREALSRGLPYVPRLLDTFEDEEGILYLVRDSVPGRSLRKVVEQDGPMRYDRACRAARAAALMAHRFHGDEPAPLAVGDLQAPNFIVEDDDTLWFVGGGATAFLVPRAGTWSASYLSRFAYVAPEMANGPTIQSDVWGVGALLYYLLTGETPPSEGAEAALTRIFALVKGLPDDVAHFLRRAMSPDPDERFSSALLAADALKVLSLLQPARRFPVDVLALPPLTFRRIALSESPVAYAIRRDDPGCLLWARLADRASQLRSLVHGDGLTALGSLDIAPYSHQVETALRVLTTSTMAGGAILADEVGLGKTIEALMIIQELRSRQMAEKVLIVVQPQGVLTWEEEVRSRIRTSGYEPHFRVYDGIADAGYPLLIVSAATLRLPGHREALAAQSYDLVVADEAHMLTGTDGQPNVLGRTIASLTRRRILLLTATPVRRRLRELYTLVSLIRPGFLGTDAEFAARFEAASDHGDAERRALRAILNGIMVRHRRRDLPGLTFPKRTYVTLVYAASRQSGIVPGLLDPLIAYLRSVDANRSAVLFAADVGIRRGVASGLRSAFPGRCVLEFDGSRTDRRNISLLFRDKPGSLLVSGDADAEGMNWQSADVVVQCDIPWNPSTWEQRVGRVYRLGQRGGHVDVVHVVRAGSRDEAVLALYEHALGLFELALGEADSLLDCLPDPALRDVEARIRQAFQSAGVRQGFHTGNGAVLALDTYRQAIVAARKSYASRCRDAEFLDDLFGLGA